MYDVVIFESLEQARDAFSQAPQSIKQWISLAQQIDCGVYDYLPPLWRNPGMAGLIAFRWVADAILNLARSLSDDEKIFLEKINDVTIVVLAMITKEGYQAFIKPMINRLFEYAGGFERLDYGVERINAIQECLADLSDEGEWGYRPQDGHFFLLVDQDYICRLQAHFGDMQTPRAQIQHAHIIVNEGMKREDSEAWWQRLSAQYGENPTPRYKSPQPGLRYLNHRTRFKVVGGYAGYTKTNSRLLRTEQLWIDSDEITTFSQQGLRCTLADYRYHITFAEVPRVTILPSFKPSDEQCCYYPKPSAVYDLFSQTSELTDTCLQVFRVNEDTVSQLMEQGRKQRRKGDDEHAEMTYRHAEEIASALGMKEIATLAKLRRAKALYYQGKNLDAQAWLATIKDLPDDTVPSLLGRYYQRLGKLYYRTGSFVESAKAWDNAHAFWEQARQNPDVCSSAERAYWGSTKTRCDKGNLLLRQGHISEGYLMHSQVLEEAAKAFQHRRSMGYAWMLSCMADACKERRWWFDAIRYLEYAQAVYTDLAVSPIHPAMTRLGLFLAEAYLHQGRHEEAKKLLIALIDQRQVRRGSTDRLMAAVYYRLGQVYQQAWDMRAARQWYAQAEDIDANQTNPTYQLTDNIRLVEACCELGDVAEAKVALGKLQDSLARHVLSKEDQSLWQWQCEEKALQIAILEMDWRQAAIHCDQIESYYSMALAKSAAMSALMISDLLDYSVFLAKWALTKVYQGEIEAIGMLYLKAAQTYQSVPVMALQWLQQVVSRGAQLSESLRAKAFLLRARLLLAQFRYEEALASVENALAVDDTLDKACLIPYQQARDEALATLGTDILVQWEGVHAMVESLQNAYVVDALGTGLLSEPARHDTVALLIKLRNLLDIAYGGWIRETLVRPQNKDWGYLYFPVHGSRKALRNALAAIGVIREPTLYCKDLATYLEKTRKACNAAKIINTLKTIGYIDKDGYLMSAYDADTELKLLPSELAMARPALRHFLRVQQANHAPITASALGRAKVLSSVISSPSALDIEVRLQQQGYVQRAEFDTGRGQNVLWLALPKVEAAGQSINLQAASDSDEVKDIWEAYASLIAAYIQPLCEPYGLENTLNRQAYALLEKAQPFTYHYTHRGEASWLDKLSLLQLESKHVRIPHQDLNSERWDRRDGIMRHRINATIHVCDPALYGWSFAVRLQSDYPHLTKEDALALSMGLLQHLKTSGYVNKKRVVAPMVWAVVHGKGFAEAVALGQLRQQLNRDLHKGDPRWCQYTDTVIDILVAKARHHIGRSTVPDDIVDVAWLLETSQEKIGTLLWAMGKARLAYQEQQRPAPVSLDEMFNESLIQVSDVSCQGIQRLRMQEQLHNVLQRYEDTHLKDNPHKVVQSYTEASEALYPHFPALALHYLERAKEVYITASGEYAGAVQLLKQCADWAQTLGAFQRAQAYLQEALSYPTVTVQRQVLYQRNLKYQQPKGEFTRQLRYYQERFLSLQSAVFEVYVNPTQPQLIHRIQNAIVDMVINLRHLLDRSWVRYVREVLRLQTTGVKFEYPYESTQARFEAFLLQQLSAPMFQVFSQSPEYNVMRDSQPFICVQWQKDEPWLMILVRLCNLAKHQQFLCPRQETLVENKRTASDLRAFYGFTYQEERVYAWSFAMLLDDLGLKPGEAEGWLDVLTQADVLSAGTLSKSDDLGKGLLDFANSPLLMKAQKDTLWKAFCQRFQKNATGGAVACQRVFERLMQLAFQQQQIGRPEYESYVEILPILEATFAGITQWIQAVEAALMAALPTQALTATTSMSTNTLSMDLNVLSPSPSYATRVMRFFTPTQTGSPQGRAHLGRSESPSAKKP